MDIGVGVSVFAYVEGEGWTRVLLSCCGEVLLVGAPYYERLSDLLHDLGNMARCISAL
jgi:hypothetical protein